MLKRLFYASASIFLLAFSYHLGATRASAAGNTIVALAGTGGERPALWAATASGDVYGLDSGVVWKRLGNVFKSLSGFLCKPHPGHAGSLPSNMIEN